MPPDDYHMSLSDAERLHMEQTAFTFHTQFGHRMRLPPRLFGDLLRSGVDTKHMEPDPSLDN